MDIEKIAQFGREHSSFLVICMLYMLLTIPFLGSSPLVWYDEGLLSEPAWHFANGEFFKQPLWTGYLEYESFSTHPNYLFFFVLGIFFKLFGLGIFQARLVSVIAGFFLLSCVYITTRKIATKRAAILAALFLVLNPLFILSARMVRQEMMTTALGFFAFMLLIYGIHKTKIINKNKSKHIWYFMCAGIFSAGAILVHLNGLFILLALIAVILILSKSWKYFLYFLSGLSLGLLPYVLFVSFNWDIFSTQFFGLWSYRLPGQESILLNIALEGMRWTKGITTPLSMIPGIFAFIYLLPHIKKWKVLYVPLVILILCFTVFDYHKYYGYLVILLPFLSIMVGIAMSSMLEKRRQKNVRAVLCSLMVIFLILNFAFIEFKIIRDSNYSYKEYCNTLKGVLDKDAIILGDASLFFCFPDGNLRDFPVQIWMHDLTGKSYKDILNEQKIEYIVLDPVFKEIVEEGKGLFKADATYGEAIKECTELTSVTSYMLQNQEKTTKIYVCDSI